MQNLLEEIEFADLVGLDVFGIGEHHRQEFLDSAPAVILAAAATRTKKIRLTSAVTVLSAADPVRVFQEFATLDLISQGRAEIVAGRVRSSSLILFLACGWRITIRFSRKNWSFCSRFERTRKFSGRESIAPR